MIWRAFFFLGLLSTLLQLTADTRAPKILWVKMEGTVELGLSPYIQRALRTAEDQKFDRVVLEVETFGGRVDAAVVIRDALLQSPVKSVAWIHNRAISAGALISLACNEIYFSPGSTMGAATPVQMGQEGAQDAGKKFVSYFRGEMGATAEARNRNRKIAEAMVMASESIPNLIKEGDVLTLNDKTALEYKISDGTVASRAELLQKLGVSETEVQNFEINWAEQVVRFITDPTVSGLLMTLGVLGIIMEIQSPGFGLPGILGISAFAVFFGGKFLVHLAGWEEVLLLILGIALIVVELFILPGFFVFGLVGFACVLASLFFAGIGKNIPLDIEMPEVASHLRGLSIAFVLTSLGLIAIWIFLTRRPSRAPLVMRGQLKKGAPPPSSLPSDLSTGTVGTATSDLRPVGKAAFGDRVLDVEADGEFLSRGASLQIVRIEGLRILVKRAER